MTFSHQDTPWFRKVLKASGQRLGARVFRLLSMYPPYAGAGIRVRRVNQDATRFEIEMRLHRWNQNYYGTHFGGSLFAMCDPFFALILTETLGPRYSVWDKSGAIEFRKPGRGTVRTVMEIQTANIETIRKQIDESGKGRYSFEAQIVDSSNDVVAVVTKTVSIRLRTEAS